jgi:hypothetical protein
MPKSFPTNLNKEVFGVSKKENVVVNVVVNGKRERLFVNISGPFCMPFNK